ncbi:MAG: hypothetical protein ACTSWN_15875 [Promethearchaeota archaeon]
MSEELLTYEVDLDRLPATFIDIFDLPVPGDIPPPVTEISNLFKAQRIIFALFDNLGLFELSQYKPEFLIKYAQAMLLLNTRNPYTLGVLHQILYGGLLPKVGHPYNPGGFHLLRYLNAHQLKTLMIGRAKDLKRYGAETEQSPRDSDTAVWVEASRTILKYNLNWLHFLDFEGLSFKAKAQGQDLDQLVKRLLLRTDKWMTSMYRQLRKNTLLIICGDHGRFKLDLTGNDKIAMMRAASVPIAIFIKKN